MLLRSLALLLFLQIPAGAAAAQAGALRLDLNIPALRLNVFEGDSLVRSYGVAVGMPGHDTPTGQFAISRAEWNPWWRPPEREWAKDDKVTPPGPNNPMGRVKLFFMPYYFIHGTPEANSIGSYASHGCVRMRNSDVIALARFLHERAAPQVTNAQIDRILSRSGTTREVPFRDSIPLLVRYDPVVVQRDTVRVYPDIYKYRAVHAEGVYQALMAAGYDVSRVKRADVQKLVDRAKAAKAPLSIPVAQVFGPGLVATRRAVASAS
jgi:murein L,D-transpeptidase YcbB/YkuD